MPGFSDPINQGLREILPVAMPEKRQRLTAKRQESGNRCCRFCAGEIIDGVAASDGRPGPLVDDEQPKVFSCKVSTAGITCLEGAIKSKGLRFP